MLMQKTLLLKVQREINPSNKKRLWKAKNRGLRKTCSKILKKNPN